MKRQVICIKIVGALSSSVIAVLGLPVPTDVNIYLGESNLSHMQTSHPDDFAKYGAELLLILAYPDYVGTNPTDGSIEYVKEFPAGDDFVKVAVRLSGHGVYFARSLYVLNSQRALNYIAKGTLKKLD